MTGKPRGTIHPEDAGWAYMGQPWFVEQGDFDGLVARTALVKLKRPKGHESEPVCRRMPGSTVSPADIKW